MLRNICWEIYVAMKNVARGNARVYLNFLSKVFMKAKAEVFSIPL